MKRKASAMAGSLTLVLVVGLWFMFAPTQLGGQVSYVILDGNSMEPGMERGDLAIVRRSGSYVVGDVVTYRHPEIGNVIHRIVNWDGERFTLQGDNNDFLDSYQPVDADILGELWFSVPKVGSFITRFQSPVYIAGLLVVALVGFGGAAGAKESRRRRRRRRRGQPQQGLVSGGSSMYTLRKNAQDISLVLVVGLVVFAGVAYLAFGRSTTKQVDETVMYSHTGAFTYEASSRAPEVYDTGQVLTGDPVFPILSQEIAVRYDYEFVTEASNDIQGAIALAARITTDNGWTRTIPVTADSTFEGATGSVAGVLDLGTVADLVQILETESGVENREYEVLITPTVSLEGTIGGAALSLVHQPELMLTFDRDQLFIARSAADQTDPLAPTEAGTTTVQTTVPNTIGFLAWDVQVSAARWGSLAGLSIVFLAAAALAFALAPNMLNPDGPRRARQREGAMVVSVQSPVEASSGPLVDLTNFSDLAVVANRMDGIILEDESGGVRSYFVQDQYVSYRYREVEATPGYVIRHNIDRAA
jgi:signal peptidase I